MASLLALVGEEVRRSLQHFTRAPVVQTFRLMSSEALASK